MRYFRRARSICAELVRGYLVFCAIMGIAAGSSVIADAIHAARENLRSR